jgi:DNA polymerase III subunit epsilon
MRFVVKAPPLLCPRGRGATFTAIDFETANAYRNSACAVGLVRVEGGRVVRRAHTLIRPPFRLFTFTYLHGIDWAAVRSSPTFAGVWPLMASFFEGVDFVAAHNAPFDASVLRAAAQQYGIALPHLPFKCTVRLARETWGLRPTTLRHVADFLGIPLRHHDAGSDAEACARIVLAAAA